MAEQRDTTSENLRTLARDHGLRTLAAGAPIVARAQEGGADGSGSFAGRAYGGGVFGQWWGSAVLDLAGYEPHGRGIFSLHNHRTYGASPEEYQVGMIPADGIEVRTFEEAGAEGMGVFVRGSYLDTEAGRSIRKTAVAGAPWELSLWTDIHASEELAPGKKEIVNGLEVVGPAIIARRWTPRECSHVEVGADLDAPLEMAASRRPEALTMPPRKTKKTTPAAVAQAAGSATATAPEATPATETQATSVDLATISAEDLRAAIEEADREELAGVLAMDEGEKTEETEAAETEDEETGGADAEETSASAIPAVLTAAADAPGSPATLDELASLATLARRPDGTLARWAGEKRTLASASLDALAEIATELVETKAKLDALAGHTAAPALSGSGEAPPAATTARAEPGEPFSGVNPGHDPESAWAASADLRDHWITKAGGDKALAKRHFLAFARIAEASADPSSTWRRRPLS
jgi:hypothetical protein